MNPRDWTPRTTAIVVLCMAILGFAIAALAQGQTKAVAVLPLVGLIGLAYHAGWQIMANGFQGFFEWLSRRRER